MHDPPNDSPAPVPAPILGTRQTLELIVAFVTFANALPQPPDLLVIVLPQRIGLSLTSGEGIALKLWQLMVFK